MSKSLKNFTIIPSSLYVNRSADRQLRTILEDMGRPGYVLVSRQMGKTNLMLNAKRELESTNVIFIYIDLSNQFKTSRDCFRSIIDNALTTHASKFQHIASNILKSRTDNESHSPNSEHELELLTLLRCYEGKIVIILDEIDALTSSDFSDQVFAQIRSIYFAGRTNFTEFNRLTYILSGVAEPSKLIKDKNKSPFNIGEKIYLDDFTYDEFIKFINKANLNFAATVIERIFYWVNGHPRMTWDLCSSVEDMYIAGQDVSVSDVDDTVHRLYLQNYDLAPVDNIRELAQSSYEIRSAIRNILTGNAVLSDSIKNKLYLAGIIKYGDKIIDIKNNLIKNALKKEWLDSIDRINKTLIAVGSEQETLGNYEDAITCYKDYISNNENISNETLNALYNYIGNCYFSLNKYKEAFEYFNKSDYDYQLQPQEYIANKYYKGAALYHDHNYIESITYFKDIINNAEISKIKCISAFKYVSIILKTDFDANIKEALIVLHKLITDIEKYGSDDKSLTEHKHIAYLNLAQVYQKTNDISSAVEMFIKSLQMSMLTYKPYILLSLYYNNSTESDKSLYIEQAIELITENNLKFSTELLKYDYSDSVNELMYNISVLYELIIASYAINRDDLKCKIIDYTLNSVLTSTKSKYLLLCELSNIALRNAKYTVRISILKDALQYLIDNKNISEPESIARTYRDIGLTYFYLKQGGYPEIDKFIALLSSINFENLEVTNDDLICLFIAAAKCREDKNYQKAIEILSIMEKLLFAQKNLNYTNHILLYYHLAQTYDKMRDKFNSSKYALAGINIIMTEALSPTELINMKQLDNIKVNLQDIKSRNTIVMPFKNSNKLGRNDLCFCGSGLKYKKCHGR